MIICTYFTLPIVVNSRLRKEDIFLLITITCSDRKHYNYDCQFPVERKPNDGTARKREDTRRRRRRRKRRKWKAWLGGAGGVRGVGVDMWTQQKPEKHLIWPPTHR